MRGPSRGGRPDGRPRPELVTAASFRTWPGWRGACPPPDSQRHYSSCRRCRGKLPHLAGCGGLGRCATLSPMRAPNFYAHPGFERAGLRRRDAGWILERIADPGSLFVPVWRNQNLVIELDGGEPRAVVLASPAVAQILGASYVGAEEHLARGEVVFLGVVEERAHFALDLSAIEAPLEMVRSPALAASGLDEAH